MFAVILCCQGFVGYFQNLGINAQSVLAEVVYERPIVGAFHGVFSIGGVVGSLIAGAFASMGWGLVEHWALWACVMTVVYLLFAKQLFSREDEEFINVYRNVSQSEPKTPQSISPSASKALRAEKLTIICLGIVGSLGLLAEQAVGDWGSI